MVVAGIVAAAMPFIHVWWKRKKRFDQFLEHLPDALDLMSRALSAGHAFSEAMHMVSAEMPEPIATEFRKTYEEQNLGLSLKLALENLTQRIPLLDLRMCVTAVLIQRETGGNLAEILEKVAYTIRERFRIMGDLKTLTTSSRMSAWLLCGLPIFVTLVITAMNPEYMSVLWKDPARPLPDCHRDDSAGYRHADRAEDFEDKDLSTKHQAQINATTNRHLNFRLHLPRHAGCLLVLYKPQSAATERLRRLGGNEGGAVQNVQSAVMPDESPATDMAQRLASPLNRLLPPSAAEAESYRSN